MSESKLLLFNNEEFGELDILFENDTPYFPATECAKILGYGKPNNAISRHCRYSLKRGVPHPQNANKTIEKIFIPEGDLYRLIMRSKLPSAQRFESWVVDVILPTIRKHGAYMTAETLYKTMSDPRELAKLLNALADEKDKNKKLTADNALLSVKAKYYDKILASPDAIPVTFIAKDYGMSASAFNRMLYHYEIQYPLRKSWCLYQDYAEKGYTQTKTYSYSENRVCVHTCWTQKGRLFLYEFLKSNGILPLCERTN